MHTSRVSVCIKFGASLLLSMSAGLLGCSGALSSAAPASAIAVTGNWQMSSSATPAAKLPALSGALTGAGRSITGILHSSAASTCVPPTTAIALSGTADANNALTLSGDLAGGRLSILGTLAEDGKSIANASYNVTGGACAFAMAVPALAQSYSSITGNYTGTFSDPQGQVISLQASLTQTPASDTSGNFQLSGTASVASNPCFNNPVSITNSQVTGGSFTLTYADGVTLNSVTASGTFSTDGRTLTVTGWTLSGPCGPDQGTGLLSR